MGTNIVEYVGREGVKSTSGAAVYSRMRMPRSGDLVQVPEELRKYPFESEWARIAETHGDGMWCDEPGELHVCCNRGSAFLREDGTVSISGGPFACIPPDCWEPTHTLATVMAWNWGDNSPGAGMGVEYTFLRPVFRLTKLPPSR